LKVQVREKSTGHVVEMWSVDAREACTIIPPGLEQPWYEYVGRAPAPEAVPLAPPPPPPRLTAEEVAAKLAERSFNDLRALAVRVDEKASKLSKEEVIASLVPHVLAGTLSLESVSVATAPPAVGLVR
jgi:hypothetical protein